ncbi:MAG: hypothetical protein ABTB30_17615, partial [Clostridia bacterium]
NYILATEGQQTETTATIAVKIRLNAEESNYHLAAWKYEGRRVAFEISHSLTDGAGVLPEGFWVF